MRYMILSILLTGCAAQSWPAWTRTAAENDCYDRHIEQACYVAHEQETAAWVGANQQMATTFGPGSQFNPINMRIAP